MNPGTADPEPGSYIRDGLPTALSCPQDGVTNRHKVNVQPWAASTRRRYSLWGGHLPVTIYIIRSGEIKRSSKKWSEDACSINALIMRGASTGETRSVDIVYFLFVGIIVIVNVMFTLLLDRCRPLVVRRGQQPVPKGTPVSARRMTTRILIVMAGSRCGPNWGLQRL